MNELNEPFFSIGIPSYKVSFFRECLDSIISQKFTDYEIIIVNDCSPEPIEKAVSEYKDARIRYYENPYNIGAKDVVLNWNKCLNLSNGKYFVLMGDDDKMETNYLQEFVTLINKFPDLDVYHCRSKIIDEDSIPLELTPSWPEYETVYDSIYHKITELRQQFVSDFVYRRSTLVNNGGYYYMPLAWASDHLTAWIACSDKGIAHTNKTIFNYRRNKFSISTSGSAELKMKAICLENDWLQLFLTKEPKGEDDKILCSEIRRILHKQIQKKKSSTITKALQNRPLKTIYFWYMKRKKYNYSLSELLYSIFQYLVKRKSKSKYSL